MTCTNNTIDMCPTCDAETTFAANNNLFTCADCQVASCDRCPAKCFSWVVCSGRDEECGKNLCSDCATQNDNDSFDSFCKECAKANVDGDASPPTCSVASQ